MAIALAILTALIGLIALGGFVTMLLLGFAAEHLGILAALGYWQSILLYILLTLFLAMTFPARTTGSQS